MTNFGLIEEDFYRVSEIERDFEVVENLHDHRFGNIALMQCIQDSSIIIMRKEKFSKNPSECEKDIFQAKERARLKHENILQMPDFSTQIIERDGGEKEMMVSGYYEYPDWDLEREIERRIEQQSLNPEHSQLFPPENLLSIIEDMLQCMTFLQDNKLIHGDLRPKYISLQTSEQPNKLNDRLGDPYSPNKVQLNHIKKRDSLYLAPILFKSLVLKKKKVKHNPYKSEIFSLGMIILECGLLKNIQGIYDLKNKKIDVEQFLQLIDDFMEIYGQIDLLRESMIWFLDLDGRTRKDPKTLLQMFLNLKQELYGQPNEQENIDHNQVFEKDESQKQEFQFLEEDLHDNNTSQNQIQNLSNQHVHQDHQELQQNLSKGPQLAFIENQEELRKIEQQSPEKIIELDQNVKDKNLVMGYYEVSEQSTQKTPLKPLQQFVNQQQVPVQQEFHVDHFNEDQQNISTHQQNPQENIHQQNPLENLHVQQENLHYQNPLENLHVQQENIHHQNPLENLHVQNQQENLTYSNPQENFVQDQQHNYNYQEPYQNLVQNQQDNMYDQHPQQNQQFQHQENIYHQEPQENIHEQNQQEQIQLENQHLQQQQKFKNQYNEIQNLQPRENQNQKVNNFPQNDFKQEIFSDNEEKLFLSHQINEQPIKTQTNQQDFIQPQIVQVQREKVKIEENIKPIQQNQNIVTEQIPHQFDHHINNVETNQIHQVPQQQHQQVLQPIIMQKQEPQQQQEIYQRTQPQEIKRVVIQPSQREEHHNKIIQPNQTPIITTYTNTQKHYPNIQVQNTVNINENERYTYQPYENQNQIQRYSQNENLSVKKDTIIRYPHQNSQFSTPNQQKTIHRVIQTQPNLQNQQLRISLEHQPDKTTSILRNETKPFAKELNAQQNDEIQVIQLSDKVKKYSLKDIPIERESNQSSTQKHTPNIYENKPIVREIQNSERQVRIVKAVNIDERQSISQQNQDYRESHRSSLSIKREFYVSPDRYRNLNDDESRNSKTYDYQVQNDQIPNHRKVVVNKRESVFQNNENPNVNIYGHQLDDLNDRYNGKLKMREKGKNFQVYRVTDINQNSFKQYYQNN